MDMDASVNSEYFEEICNEFIRQFNRFVEKSDKTLFDLMADVESPIYETIGPNSALILSKNREGVLVAYNSESLGEVQIKRVPYPKPKKGSKIE